MDDRGGVRLTVGLTGGLASGKSTVARWLAEKGLTVVDADRLVADLYRPGQPGAAAVKRLFGDDLLDQRGGVDHRKLGALVFADPAARRALEAAIHPLVGEAFRDLLEHARGIVVMEATLLVETGGADRYDVLVTVEADPELRVQRAIGRGTDPESARARLAAQATAEARIAKADYVLWNDGSLDALRAQVDELAKALQARLAASRSPG
ncbi:MAG TPA: dephospho-CoA kinase [Thermoanaerobaculia bacterium]|nr:dephospho-CoA kinase [Thermoanaerobaculia bacterium]